MPKIFVFLIYLVLCAALFGVGLLEFGAFFNFILHKTGIPIKFFPELPLLLSFLVCLGILFLYFYRVKKRNLALDFSFLKMFLKSARGIKILMTIFFVILGAIILKSNAAGLPKKISDWKLSNFPIYIDIFLIPYLFLGYVVGFFRSLRWNRVWPPFISYFGTHFLYNRPVYFLVLFNRNFMETFLIF